MLIKDIIYQDKLCSRHYLAPTADILLTETILRIKYSDETAWSPVLMRRLKGFLFLVMVSLSMELRIWDRFISVGQFIYFVWIQPNVERI